MGKSLSRKQGFLNDLIFWVTVFFIVCLLLKTGRYLDEMESNKMWTNPLSNARAHSAGNRTIPSYMNISQRII